MRKVAFGLLACLAVASTASAVELITNGTFDSDTSSWNFISAGQNDTNPVWHTFTSVAGGVSGNAGRIYINKNKAIDTFAYQVVTVPFSGTAVLTGSWKLDGAGGSPWAGAFLFASDGTDPVTQLNTLINPILRGQQPNPQPRSNTDGKIVAAADDHSNSAGFTLWDTFANYADNVHALHPADFAFGSERQTKAFTAGQTVIVGMYFLDAPTGANSEYAYFDNISLALTPEPAAIVLLGLGAIPLLRRRR
jgi:MYXO-CTERM domain-containing protein